MSWMYKYIHVVSLFHSGSFEASGKNKAKQYDFYQFLIRMLTLIQEEALNQIQHLLILQLNCICQMG